MQRATRTLISMLAGAALVVVVLLAARAYAQDETPTTIAGGTFIEQPTDVQPTDGASVDAVQAVARTLTYQGVLLAANNTPVPNATYNMVFTLYVDNSSPVWQETQSVVVVDGFFSVRLGSVTALSVDEFVDRQMFLGVRVDRDAEMTPRQPFTQVPYAMVAERLNQFRSYGVVNADGSRRNGFRFTSTLDQGGNFYLIDIKENYDNGQYVTLVTPVSTSANPACLGSISPQINGSGGRLLIELFDSSNNRQRCAFHFAVLDLP